MGAIKGRRNASGKNTNKGTIIREDKKVKIVNDPNELKVGHKNEGWVLAKKYERFNLWIKRVNGHIIRECFRKYEIPKKVQLMEDK